METGNRYTHWNCARGRRHKAIESGVSCGNNFGAMKVGGSISEVLTTKGAIRIGMNICGKARDKMVNKQPNIVPIYFLGPSGDRSDG